MRNKGVTGAVYNWISAWHSDRTQPVRVGDEESEASTVKSGEPQGSVLGPVEIFVLFSA